MRTGRESEKGGNAAKKIDDGKGWQKSCARDGTRVSPCAEQRRDSEDGKSGGGWFPLYSTSARMQERGSRCEGGRGGRRGERGDRWDAGGLTGVLGGWVLVRFSRGKRRRGVRAASGWCIIDPSVCGLGKKRSLRLGPRKRQSNTPAAYRGEKETPPRRPISQTDIRNAFASYPACGGTR